jgi:hypothetical protein
MTNSFLEFLADYTTFLGVRFQNWMILLLVAFALWIVFKVIGENLTEALPCALIKEPTTAKGHG